MILVDEEFKKRVEAMVKRAGGNRPLAEQLGVTDSAIRSWLVGSKPFDSTLKKVGDFSGVSALWIRDGIGDDDRELAKIKKPARRGSRSDFSQDITQDTLQETPADYGGPLGALKAAMLAHDMSAADLAKAIGYKTGPVQALFERRSPISESMAEKIVTVLPELDTETLLGGSESPRIVDPTGRYATVGSKSKVQTDPDIKSRTIPMIAFAQAGAAVNFEDEAYDYEGITVYDVKDPRAIATRVRGDSMEPRIREGDIIVYLPSFEPRNGDIVLARLRDGDVMCKIYQARGPDIVVLSSYNPAHPSIELRRAQIEKIYPVDQIISKARRD